MAKKIEGLSRYTDISPSGRIVVRLLGESDYQCKAVTVVVHEGTHERVFTESEVRAMMEDVKAIAAEHSRKCYTNRIEQMTPPAPVAFIIDDYLRKKHGITLDPA